MGAVTGKRISRSHTTAIDLAAELALFLDKSGVVTKVSLGIITARAGCKTRKVIIANDQFNLRVTVMQPPAKQELYVSSPDRTKTIVAIGDWCTSKDVEFTVR
jgi:hypothetical protein